MEPREEWLQVNLPNPSFHDSAAKKECTHPFVPPPRFLSRFALFSCHFWVRFFVRKLDPWSPPGLVHAYLYIFRRFFGHQKRIFWKQSPWGRVFENARLWFKGESFLSPEPLGFVTDQETTGSGDENGYERTRICWCHSSFSACSVRDAIVFYRLRVFLWMVKNDATLYVEAYIFFWKRRKSLRF